jgi:hypothetical protein
MISTEHDDNKRIEKKLVSQIVKVYIHYYG